MTAAIDPFRAMAIGRRAHQLLAAGRDVIQMHYGQPSTGAPAAAVAAAQDVLARDPMGYWESEPLKRRIARHYAETQGIIVVPERITLTCGASPALVLALSSLFAPGDRVALARPGYVAYRNTLKALHLVPVELPCGSATRFQLDAAMLAALDPAPAGVIVASPANPTGTIIPPDALAAIAAVCRDRGIRIVSDEIYHGLTFTDPTETLLRHDPGATVINSFSKYWSMAGWRLGWVVAPDDAADAVQARMSNLFLTPPSLAQHAGLVAMDCHDELQGHLATYAANRALLLAALPAMGLGRIAPPDGAFYLYADVGHLTDDSLALAHQLLEDTGVSTAPGVDFDPVDGGRFLRFSFAVSTPEVEEAIRRLAPWFEARRAA